MSSETEIAVQELRMTSDEAVEAAKRIKPKTAIPMHYDSIVGSLNDALKFKKSLEGFCEVAILEK